MSSSFDPKAIAAEVRANLETLDACSLHDFIGLPEGAMRCKDGILYRKYRCSKCGGTCDAHARDWYELGLKHAKGGPR